MRSIAFNVIKRYGSFAVYFLLCISFFSSIGRLTELYPTLSLRYHEGLSSEQIECVNAVADTAFFPTLWMQVDHQSVSSQLQTHTATVLSLSGKGAAVYPTSFLSGGYPSKIAPDGCAVSSALAWQLWGGCDVTGLALTYDEKKYQVSGVFEDKDSILMLQMAKLNSNNKFTAIELEGDFSRDGSGSAEKFTTLAGLPKPDAVVNIPAMINLFYITAFLCILCLGVSWILRRSKVSSISTAAPAIYGKRIGLLLLLFLGLALPFLVSFIPPRFIPTHWSDFGFWASLWHDCANQFTELLSITPVVKDVNAKKAAIQLLSSFFGILFLGAYRMR